MREKRIFFKAEDNLELEGILSEPEIKTNKIILSIHGMISTCLSKRECRLAEKITEKGISYFSFSNRGHDVMALETAQGEAKICGTAYEEIFESIYDIIGALKTIKKMGYTKIYLQGHSLGCTKVVYCYQKIQQEYPEWFDLIKAVLLLSLIDIPRCHKVYVGEKYTELLDYAIEKEKQGKLMEFMPPSSFIYPVSVKTYLRYVRDNKEIDFARYHDKTYGFKELNLIKVPLFMRWGDQNEMIEQTSEELITYLKEKIHNPNLDINYIHGADHSYHEKEDILAKEILEFLLTK